MKQCSRCKIIKPCEEFGKRQYLRKTSVCHECEARVARIRYSNNKDKIAERQRARRADNPEIIRHYNLKRIYGISLSDWHEMFEKQGMRCAICGTDKPLGRGWQTDHNHKTGKLRQILCHHCNSGIGHFMENPEIIRSALSYLEKHSTL